jgi:hypothetical protein
MRTIDRLRAARRYKKKELDDNVQGAIRLQFHAKPVASWTVEVPRADGKVDVFRINPATISPNTTFSVWEIGADYDFTYTPSKKEYHYITGAHNAE